MTKIIFAILFCTLTLGLKAELKCYAPDGKIPEVTELIDDEIAFAQYAETASFVAFDRLPRANLLHSWKSLGVTVLKTIRVDSEMSPERYRREAGFLAFKAGADGLYLVGRFEGESARALEEAKEDWRVMEYVRGLREKALANEDGLIRIEGRRATYYLQGILPAEWENLDTLRFEAVAWAKRLEQILGLPPAALPTTLPEKPLAARVDFKPYASAAPVPEPVTVGAEGKTVKAKNGLEFAWDTVGFSITVETRASLGGELRFRLYIPGRQAGEWMPYRYHCDLNPCVKGTVRAPALGRGSCLYGTDERFIPYSQAYAADNNRVREWPCLRSHGPDCPDLRPALNIEPVKGGGYRAKFSVSWLSLYGRWPMQGDGTTRDVWYVGVDALPGTDEPIACRLHWPKPNKQLFEKFCERFAKGAVDDLCQEELARTNERWILGSRDHYYRFLETKEPCFNCGDFASDEMFRLRMVKPLIDASKGIRRMRYLSHAVGLLRRDYLVGRFAGRVPPEPKVEPNDDNAVKNAPDVDFDDDAIELDGKEP